MQPTPPTEVTQPNRATPRSLALILAAWLALHIGGLFSPGLLDDVDSIYIEIARQMIHRHDVVTPYINGIRFFDKPPLMYWMAAASMTLFGESDWAARLPLALATLALFLSVYALGRRFWGERGGLYSALATATSIGPYLYTRFYIPDILICLWMTLGTHLFLIAVERVRGGDRVTHVSPLRHGISESPTRQSDDRILHPHHDRVPHPREGSIVAGWGALPHQPQEPSAPQDRVPHPLQSHRIGWGALLQATHNSPLLPSLAFAAVLALNLLTKGLIGLVFPLGFVLLYLTLTRQLPLLKRLHSLSAAATFVAIAAPWHILAALRNPAIPLPAGLGLPATAGWAWFYLYNEHFARFLGRRIPHDYGNTPVWLFWLYAAIWIMPWTTFIPAALAQARHTLKREATLTLNLWAGLVLIFFSISSRQEYYSLPAIPALALIAGGVLAQAEQGDPRARRNALRSHLWLLVPIASLVAAICGYFALTAPHPAPGTDLAALLAGNPDLYNLSLGHIFDLTGAAMGLFRAPLAAVAVGMIAVGPGSYLLRRAQKHHAADLTLAAAMILTLTAAHEGLRRFYPILGSKPLAEAVNRVRQPEDLIVLDGEFTSGSSLAFYTRQPVHLVDGRVNTLWFGSFWPDAPHVFEDEASLRTLWASRQRIFLFTYHPADRTRDLAPFGPVHVTAASGGKTILSNR